MQVVKSMSNGRRFCRHTAAALVHMYLADCSADTVGLAGTAEAVDGMETAAAFHNIVVCQVVPIVELVVVGIADIVHTAVAAAEVVPTHIAAEEHREGNTEQVTAETLQA